MAPKQCAVLIALACLACVASGQANQTVLPAASANQSSSTPTQQYQASGASTPTICAEGDLSCSAALIQPLNDTEYTNCVVSPSAPNCTSAQAGAATESAADPEDSCPTTAILDQGISEADLETQVRQLNYSQTFAVLYATFTVSCSCASECSCWLCADCSLCQRCAARP